LSECRSYLQPLNTNIVPFQLIYKARHDESEYSGSWPGKVQCDSVELTLSKVFANQAVLHRPRNRDIPVHTISQTIALHLVPGALITAFYFLTAPLVIHAGDPALMSLLLAILFILIPFELGFLLYQGYQQNGRLPLKNIVLYREPMPVWQYFVLVPLLLGWCVAAFVLLSPLDDYLIYLSAFRISIELPRSVCAVLRMWENVN
jgi:hypothetical protein